MTLSPTTIPAVSYIYPRHVLKKGSTDSESVLLIQQRLNKLGCGPVAEDGVFGLQTERAVRLLQIRFTDAAGIPLKVDGMVGPITWAAMFGSQTVPVRHTTSNLLGTKTIETAAGEIGVTEMPPYSNRGPRVDEYIRATGLNPVGQKYAWCACFVYWWVREAALANSLPNPALRIPGVQNLWRKAKAATADNSNGNIRTITAAQAMDDPSLLKPGMVFCLNRGAGLGHTGFVEEIRGGRLITIEGNTNPAQSYTGGGVFRHTGRKLSQIDLGYIEYL